MGFFIPVTPYLGSTVTETATIFILEKCYNKLIDLFNKAKNNDTSLNKEPVNTLKNAQKTLSSGIDDFRSELSIKYENNKTEEKLEAKYTGSEQSAFSSLIRDIIKDKNSEIGEPETVDNVSIEFISTTTKENTKSDKGIIKSIDENNTYPIFFNNDDLKSQILSEDLYNYFYKVNVIVERTSEFKTVISYTITEIKDKSKK